MGEESGLAIATFKDHGARAEPDPHHWVQGRNLQHADPLCHSGGRGRDHHANSPLVLDSPSMKVLYSTVRYSMIQLPTVVQTFPFPCRPHRKEHTKSIHKKHLQSLCFSAVVQFPVVITLVELTLTISSLSQTRHTNFLGENHGQKLKIIHFNSCTGRQSKFLHLDPYIAGLNCGFFFTTEWF